MVPYSICKKKKRLESLLFSEKCCDWTIFFQVSQFECLHCNLMVVMKTFIHCTVLIMMMMMMMMLLLLLLMMMIVLMVIIMVTMIVLIIIKGFYGTLMVVIIMLFFWNLSILMMMMIRNLAKEKPSKSSRVSLSIAPTKFPLVCSCQW